MTTLNHVRFLKEKASLSIKGETNIQVINVIDAWNDSDFLCRNYLLNSLSDFLYCMYDGKKKAKEL